MTNIVAFRKDSSMKRKPPPAGSAEVLFFTGVRYEHHTHEGAHAPRKSRPRKSAANDVASALA